MSDILADVDDIATGYFPDLVIKNQFSLTIDKRPHLVPMSVYLITDAFPSLDSHLPGQSLVPVFKAYAVNHLLFSPVALLVHGTALQFVSIKLDVLALFLVRNQYAIVRCGDYHVPGTDTHDRYFQLIDHMGIL